MSMERLRKRFRGCLLGLAIGDALGGRFEARSAEAVRERCPTPQALHNYPQDELHYTDDTQMPIGVAETLIQHGRIDEPELCRAFVANYVPARGYGRGARAVLDAMEEGRDHRAVAEAYHPGGSYGNGAAMRVAPVGLLFHRDSAQLLEQARLSALPTHRHPHGIEGAQLLALAVGLCVSRDTFNAAEFFATLRGACTSPEYRERMAQASAVRVPADLAPLGNNIDALRSVPTAIASFALNPSYYLDAIAQVILLGGDTDTLAAMAGALAGAHLGSEGLPPRLVQLLEDHVKGRSYLIELADRLAERVGEKC